MKPLLLLTLFIINSILITTTFGGVADVPSLRKNKLYLNERYEIIQKEIDSDLSKHNIIFLGDSITQGWVQPNRGLLIWEKNFSEGHFKSLNLGVSGDRTENILSRILSKNEGGLGHFDNPTLTPKLIILKIGINNTFKHRNDEITKGIQAIIVKLNQKFPKTKILLLSILPSQDHKRTLSHVVPINNTLKKLPQNPSFKQFLHYYNLNQHFINEDGKQITEYFSDQLHLNTKGYERWAEFLLPQLSTILSY